MAEKTDDDSSIPLKKIVNDDPLRDEVDDIQRASDIYGEWGPLQRNVLIFFVLIYIVASFQNTGVIFYLSPIAYHCVCIFHLYIECRQHNSSPGSCVIPLALRFFDFCQCRIVGM